MCRVLKINRSGFYAWLKQPMSMRVIEDNRLLKLIKAAYIASGGTYGSPWIHRDLREAGESCSVHGVAKIMRLNKRSSVTSANTSRAASHQGLQKMFWSVILRLMHRTHRG